MMLLVVSCLLTSAVVGAVERSAVIEGDLVVGALFSVHEAPSGDQGTLNCGQVREQYGIQRVETALFTVDEINRNRSILPGVTLGLEARDSCWSSPVALQESIELVRDAITPVLINPSNHLDDADPATCPEHPSQPKKKAPLVGVIGPGSSSVTLQVQNLLQLFSIPQVGYSATSRDLSDKKRFSTFLRVVPGDSNQAQLLVTILLRFNWTYVSTVNTDENYGTSGIQAFREKAEVAGICVAKEDKVLSNADNSSFDKVLMNLHEDKLANVVVCFCEGKTMMGLLRASKRLNMTGRFTFIGSDGWADREEVVAGSQEEAWGSLSIRIHSPYMKEFEHHYFSLNPFNNSRNPWFQEFWEQKFNCALSMNVSVEKKKCTGEEKLSEHYTQDPKMSYVMKSLWAMGLGLHSMLQEICGTNYTKLCRKMVPFDGKLFMRHLMNLSFTFSEETVRFDKDGDPPGRYEILNYQRRDDETYGYELIGEWNGSNESLIIDETKLQTRKNKTVVSVCSTPCEAGFYKSSKTGGQEKNCCWSCLPCHPHEIVSENQTHCIDCREGKWPNANKTDCFDIPEEYVAWGDAEAIVAMTFSAVGLAATFVTCRIFVRHNDTPVVKASTRELSYLILAGMALAHIAVFPILAKPTKISCAFSRLMPGVSFAMMYASLFTKTNRIARILAGSKKRFPTRKPLFMSATAQVVITCSMILLEAGVATAMLVIEPPESRPQYPDRQTVMLTCATSPTAVLSPLAFDALLLALCTLYAIKTRNVPENFNEAKFIGFAMYTTCVIWVAFVPIYFGNATKVITMCMCVTLSASVTLIFLFLPKLYIIVLRPERNNRALFTTSKSIRCHIGARVAAAIAEPPSKRNVYRLSGSAETENTTCRSGVSRRSLSVQTGAELLTSLYRPRESPYRSREENSTPPVRLQSATRENARSDEPRCSSAERISRSNESVWKQRKGALRPGAKAYGSQDKLQPSTNGSGTRLCADRTRSDRSLPIGGSQMLVSEWARLDARALVDDLRKCTPQSMELAVHSYSSEKNHAKRTLSSSYGRIVDASASDAAKGELALTGNELSSREEELAARIREENDHLPGTDDPVIKITITLGSEMPDRRVDRQPNV